MKQALLVIDFINDIMHPDGKISRCADYVMQNNVIDNANKVIATARKQNLPIIHVRVGFSENYIECPKHSPLFAKAPEFKALQLGTWGTAFHDNMDVQAQDTVIIKHRVSALYATPLATVLGAQQIEHVIIIGVSTDNTVELTAREAHDRDYKVTVIADACGTVNEVRQQAALETIGRIADVKTVAEFV